MVARLDSSVRPVIVHLDSLNHLRNFDVGVTRVSRVETRMQTSSESLDTNGHVLYARRTFLTETAAGLKHTTRVALSESDAVRLHDLAAEVARRCVR